MLSDMSGRIVPPDVDWLPIPRFPNYEICVDGTVLDLEREEEVSASHNQHGLLRVNLIDEDGVRRTMPVKNLVAHTFSEPPTDLMDTVIVVDYDQQNCHVENLSWRPRWFAHQYSKQRFEARQPRYRMSVANVITGLVYPDIVQASLDHGGLLFAQVHESARSHIKASQTPAMWDYFIHTVYPTGHIYEFVSKFA